MRNSRQSIIRRIREQQAHFCASSHVIEDITTGISCLVCRMSPPETPSFFCNLDGSSCFGGNDADMQHLYCSACIVDRIHTSGPFCVSCNQFFDHMDINGNMNTVRSLVFNASAVSRLTNVPRV